MNFHLRKGESKTKSREEKKARNEDLVEEVEIEVELLAREKKLHVLLQGNLVALRSHFRARVAALKLHFPTASASVGGILVSVEV